MLQLPEILRTHNMRGRRNTSGVFVIFATENAIKQASPLRNTATTCQSQVSASERAVSAMIENHPQPQSIQTYGLIPTDFIPKR